EGAEDAVSSTTTRSHPSRRRRRTGWLVVSLACLASVLVVTGLLYGAVAACNSLEATLRHLPPGPRPRSLSASHIEGIAGIAAFLHLALLDLFHRVRKEWTLPWSGGAWGTTWWSSRLHTASASCAIAARRGRDRDRRHRDSMGTRL